MPSPFPLAIVVPIHNEQDILMANLSFLASEFNEIFGSGGWKYVLVDNASTDATPTIIRTITICILNL